MRRKTLARFGSGSGWAHPYGHGPFSPFLYADGGDGDDSGSGDSGNADGDDGADSGASTGGNSSGGDSGSGRSQNDKGDDSAATIRELKKELADARKEAGKARTDAKKQAADDAVSALTQQLGKALGFVKDDTPPDPKALADAIAQKDTALSQKDAALRAKDVELAVWARADKAKARAGALLDSRSFVAAISELDPSDKGFTAALDKAIKDAVDENKSFASVPPAGKSGGDLSGGTREGSAKRGGSLAGAISNHYGT